MTTAWRTDGACDAALLLLGSGRCFLGTLVLHEAVNGQEQLDAVGLGDRRVAHKIDVEPVKDRRDVAGDIPVAAKDRVEPAGQGIVDGLRQSRLHEALEHHLQQLQHGRQKLARVSGSDLVVELGDLDLDVIHIGLELALDLVQPNLGGDGELQGHFDTAQVAADGVEVQVDLGIDIVDDDAEEAILNQQQHLFDIKLRDGDVRSRGERCLAKQRHILCDMLLFDLGVKGQTPGDGADQVGDFVENVLAQRDPDRVLAGDLGAGQFAGHGWRGWWTGRWTGR
ncbi:uncharacterized protein BJ171DRAFT_495224 [Polychytrium aggregatum]|uniref:uncharacterized protein n=1 Tax=Polychytrium aggregatum TaxID=110093 RepID=UPI0022FE7220|nr:uncharacterized protein BJ171DRAFT_495224 [Polychytrium aggregatum]KAI9206944.1 hypothetical protein BJ171DRAFT_495224 [Polychytrium aggregatum]